MQLRCQHCRVSSEHVRSAFLGAWVVCHECERPFAWREAEVGGNGAKPSGEQGRPQHLPGVKSAKGAGR